MIEQAPAHIHVPHDPPYIDGQYGEECQECGVKWPCPERTRQRAEKKRIDAYLASDLYKPVSHPKGGVLWESPLGWQAWLSYGERGLRMVVHDRTDRSKWVGSEDATVFWLDKVLP